MILLHSPGKGEPCACTCVLPTSATSPSRCVCAPSQAVSQQPVNSLTEIPSPLALLPAVPQVQQSAVSLSSCYSASWRAAPVCSAVRQQWWESSTVGEWAQTPLGWNCVSTCVRWQQAASSPPLFWCSTFPRNGRIWLYLAWDHPLLSSGCS